jgi:hypothetical protein
MNGLGIPTYKNLEKKGVKQKLVEISLWTFLFLSKIEKCKIILFWKNIFLKN